MNSTTSKKKILIISPAWLGDAVMSLGFIANLRQHHISVLTPKYCQGIYQRATDVNQIFIHHFAHGQLALKKRYQIAKSLGSFDAVFLLSDTFKMAFLARFVPAKKCIGFATEGRSFLLTHAIKKPKNQTMLENYLSLLPKGKIIFPVLKTNEHNQKKFQKLKGQKKLIVLAPSAAYGKTKQWPYFDRLINHFHNYAVWAIGSGNDKKVIDDIIKKTKHSFVKNFAGKMTVEESIDLISLADVVVSNDSAPLHFAAALKKPVVALYGSTSAGYTPPLIENNLRTVIQSPVCTPCFKKTCRYGDFRCQYAIEPKRVIKAVEQFLKL